MRYKAITRNNRSFELANERQQVTGQLNYTSWIPTKADMTTGDGSLYKAYPTGLWGKIVIAKNEQPVAEIKSDWGMGLILSFDNGAVLRVKRKSFWDPNYIVTGNDDQALAEMQVEFKWRKMSYDYTIDMPYDLPDRTINSLLPMLLIYCVKYIRMRSS